MEILKSILDALGSAKISVAFFLASCWAYSQKLNFTVAGEVQWSNISLLIAFVTGLIVLNSVIAGVLGFISPIIKKWIASKVQWKEQREVIDILSDEELSVLLTTLKEPIGKFVWVKSLVYRLYKAGILDYVGEGAQMGIKEGFAVVALTPDMQKTLTKHFKKYPVNPSRILPPPLMITTPEAQPK